MKVLEWKFARFDALAPRELYAIMRARVEVFVVEQQCPYLDPDGDDPRCFHLWAESGGELVAYLRVVPPGVKYPEPSLGRILTRGKGRGSGTGKELVALGIAKTEELFGAEPIRIGAQRYLLRFYERFGFARTGFDYDEDGIPHSEMIRTAR